MFKVLFVSSGNHGDISPIVKAQGKSIENLGLSIQYFAIKGRGVVGYLSNTAKLHKFIKENKPDIIHAHYSLSGIVSALASQRKSIIVSLMGSDTKTRFLLRQTIKYFSNSFWAKTIVKSKSMLKDSGVKQATIIPNGVDIKQFLPQQPNDAKTTFKFSKNKSSVLFLANPARESKNFQLANEAFKHLDPAKVELQVRYNIPQNHIPNLLNAADIILLTSKWEGSPNVVKEAMACNCPVVATNISDIEWLFGNEPGHFLTSFDPEDVAKKLKEALEYSLKYGRTNGRKRIIKLGLDSETVAKRLLNLYQDVLQKAR